MFDKTYGDNLHFTFCQLNLPLSEKQAEHQKKVEQALIWQTNEANDHSDRDNDDDIAEDENDLHPSLLGYGIYSMNMLCPPTIISDIRKQKYIDEIRKQLKEEIIDPWSPNSTRK